MATLNGTNLIVTLGGTAIALSKECNLDISNAGRDITTKSSAGWSESAVDGLRSWKVSGKGLVDFTLAAGTPALTTLMMNRTTVTLVFGATGSGNKYYTGTAVIKDVKFGASVEETATYDFEFTGTGALTESSHT